MITKESGFLSKLDWSKVQQPIAEKYTNLLYQKNPYTDEDMHVEMGYYTHLQSLDSPTLTEILTMEDKEEQQRWFEAMDEEIRVLLSKHTFQRKRNSNIQSYGGCQYYVGVQTEKTP
jgi:hypothetical protein